MKEKKRREWDSGRVRALREHMGLTQQEMADQLGTRQQTISEWETGMYPAVHHPLCSPWWPRGLDSSMKRTYPRRSATSRKGSVYPTRLYIAFTLESAATQEDECWKAQVVYEG
jgi:DNA-binding XRE family transcriptional regulator